MCAGQGTIVRQRLEAQLPVLRGLMEALLLYPHLHALDSALPDITALRGRVQRRRMHVAQITTVLLALQAQLHALLIQEVGEGPRNLLILTATAMRGIMMLMRGRRAAVLWGLGITRLRILIRGRSALRGIMGLRQQIQ